MKKTLSFLSVIIVVILFSNSGHAQSIPLVKTNFRLEYSRSPCHGGYGWYLPVVKVFTFKKGKVHISGGNLSDKTRCYGARMGLSDRFKLKSDFKIELSFKNIRVIGSCWGDASLSIWGHDSGVTIGIGSSDKQYRFWTHLHPDNPRRLDIPAHTNSGTFVIEKKGTNLTLSVKGDPRAKITYNGLYFDETWINFGTWSNSGCKTEVDITKLNIDGLIPPPPGPPTPKPPAPPPPPQPHSINMY